MNNYRIKEAIRRAVIAPKVLVVWLFFLDSKPIHMQPHFWLSIIIPGFLSIYVFYHISEGYVFVWPPTEISLDRFFDLIASPLKIFMISPIWSGVIITIHRSIISSISSNYTNLQKHKDEFFEYLDKIEEKYPISFLDKPDLYKRFCPNSSIRNGPELDAKPKPLLKASESYKVGVYEHAKYFSEEVGTQWSELTIHEFLLTLKGIENDLGLRFIENNGKDLGVVTGDSLYKYEKGMIQDYCLILLSVMTKFSLYFGVSIPTHKFENRSAEETKMLLDFMEAVDEFECNFEGT
jgi:hypothetical protein